MNLPFFAVEDMYRGGSRIRSKKMQKMPSGRYRYKNFVFQHVLLQSTTPSACTLVLPGAWDGFWSRISNGISPVDVFLPSLRLWPRPRGLQIRHKIAFSLGKHKANNPPQNLLQNPWIWAKNPSQNPSQPPENQPEFHSPLSETCTLRFRRTRFLRFRAAAFPQIPTSSPCAPTEARRWNALDFLAGKSCGNCCGIFSNPQVKKGLKYLEKFRSILRTKLHIHSKNTSRQLRSADVPPQLPHSGKRETCIFRILCVFTWGGPNWECMESPSGLILTGIRCNGPHLAPDTWVSFVQVRCMFKMRNTWRGGVSASHLLWHRNPPSEIEGCKCLSYHSFRNLYIKLETHWIMSL